MDSEQERGRETGTRPRPEPEAGPEATEPRGELPTLPDLPPVFDEPDFASSPSGRSPARFDLPSVAAGRGEGRPPSGNPRAAVSRPPAPSPEEGGLEVDLPASRHDAESLWSELVGGGATPPVPPSAAERSVRELDGAESEGGLRRRGAVEAIARLAEELGPGSVPPEVLTPRRSSSRPPPAELADAADDDRTDPDSPTARRLSDRPPRSPRPPAVESVAPPPVSVTLPIGWVEPLEPEAGLEPGKALAEPGARRPGIVLTVGAGLVLAALGGLLLIGLRLRPSGAEATGIAAHATEAAAAVAAPPPARIAFDRAAATRSLASAAARAAACPATGAPPAPAKVEVTFSPATGAVTQVLLSGAPYAGTPTGACIGRALRVASVPPFSGESVTIEQSIPMR